MIGLRNRPETMKCESCSYEEDEILVDELGSIDDDEWRHGCPRCGHEDVSVQGVRC